MAETNEKAASDPDRAQWWRVKGRIATLGVLGAVVLSGWTFHIDLLRSLLPGAVPVNPLAALAFESAALSAWLRREGKPAGWRARIAFGTGLFVCVVGLTALIDSLCDTKLCPDYLMFHAQIRPVDRIAGSFALCFLLVGLALLTTDSARSGERLWHPQWLPAPVVPLFMYAFSDYLFEGANTTGRLMPLSVGTAYGLVAIAMVIWNLRRSEGPMAYLAADNPSAQMIRTMLPISGFLPVALGGISMLGYRSGWLTVGGSAAVMVFNSVIAIFAITAAISWRLIQLDSMRRKTLSELRERASQDEAAARLSEALMKTEEVLRAVNSQAPADVADKLLSFLGRFLGVPQLCLYMLESGQDEPKLATLACYAFGDSRQLNIRVGLGEGLVGQCAEAKHLLAVNDVPQDYFTIRSATFELLPKQLLFVPLVIGDKAIGVLEIAILKPLSDEMMEFLHKASRIIAFALFRLHEQLRLQRLLGDLASSRRSESA